MDRGTDRWWQIGSAKSAARVSSLYKKFFRLVIVDHYLPHRDGSAMFLRRLELRSSAPSQSRFRRSPPATLRPRSNRHSSVPRSNRDSSVRRALRSERSMAKQCSMARRGVYRVDPLRLRQRTNCADINYRGRELPTARCSDRRTHRFLRRG
jgi:hypothetical protein